MWLVLAACAPLTTPGPAPAAPSTDRAAPHGAHLPHRAPPGPALDPGARDDDGDGHVAREDCDDADPAVHVGVPELADGRDQDCDQRVDEGLGAVDHDGDGWSAEAGDPDDADPSRHPGAAERPGDGVDQNGDGSEAWPAVPLGRADLVIAEVEPAHAGRMLGAGVALLEDMDGDGVGEVAVRGTAQDGTTHGGDGVGASWVWSGRSRGVHGAAGAALYVPDEGVGVSGLAALADGGDLDGDGFADLLVGLPRWEGGEELGGWLGVFDAQGPWERRLSGARGSLLGAEGAMLGTHLGRLADADGDGRGGLWYQAWDPATGEERVRVRGGLSTRGELDAGEGEVDGGQVSELRSSAPLDSFGAAVAQADFDGDGLLDLAVSAWGDRKAAGAVYLVPSPWTGSVVVQDVAVARLWGGAEGAEGGAALSVGDGDGDGHPDLALSAPRDSGSAEAGGWVGVFRGPVAGDLPFTDAPLQVRPELERDELGAALAMDGDLDGSGAADLVLGSPRPNGAPLPGRVHVFFDPADGVWSTAESDGVLFGAPGDQAGRSLASGKDLDHDGLDELVVGAPWEGAEQVAAGKAYLWTGASLRGAFAAP